MADTLYREAAFPVRTKFGRARVIACPLTRSGSVIFLTRPRKLGRGEKGLYVPTGTAIVAHRELAQRTGGKVTHLVIRDGLYRLYGQAIHVAKGSDDDLCDIRLTEQDLIDCASFLRVSGQLPLDYHEKVAGFLEKIGNDLDHPKRNEHKLNAALRSMQAAHTRYGDGRIKPGPGRIVTLAASSHARKRINELKEICPAVNYTAARVYKLMTRLHGILHLMWRTFTENLVGGLPLPIQTAMARQSRSLTNVESSERDIEEFEAWLDHEFFIQPFTELSRRLKGLMKELRKRIRAHDAKGVSAEVNGIVELLRRLRMVRYIELNLLALLSGDAGEEAMSTLASRYKKLLARVRDMSDTELDRRLRDECVDYLELFLEDLENGERESAKRMAKRLTALLATA